MGNLNVSQAWEELFEKYDIANQVNNNGTFKISANQIKEFKEPRLMTKFDWSSSLPKLFKDNDLAILPDTRGSYVIGQFKAYQDLLYEEINPIRVSIPEWVNTFDDFAITSESVALNIAQMSGMINAVMGVKIGQPDPVATITGRLKSNVINYQIKMDKVKQPFLFTVDNSQVEIDAGFESIDKLAIIEAKNKIPKDFIIRQLYYPYVIYNNLGTGKEVIPIYLTHSDDIYAFHIFKFEDVGSYSSIKKIKQINFIVDQDLNITFEELKSISQNSKNIVENKKDVFPQADSFTRILMVLKHLLQKPQSTFELAEEFEINPRQGDYYGNALVYLGFAYKDNGKYVLTKLGDKIGKAPNGNMRNREIVRSILAHKIFNDAFINLLHNNRKIDREYVTNLLLNQVPSINSIVTAKRRSSTIRAWLNWVLSVAMTE